MNGKVNVSKEFNVKHKNIREGLPKLSDNREYVDCKAKGPRWTNDVGLVGDYGISPRQCGKSGIAYWGLWNSPKVVWDGSLPLPFQCCWYELRDWLEELLFASTAMERPEKKRSRDLEKESLRLPLSSFFLHSVNSVNRF
ncbi:hypothetical protein VNO77_43952 [Canavalia gladiata]|uniref:Uncharacterized protein n=1 Tax=Canavalia gladiata TaxID=3824 RepID=A0AAN9JVS7_CANGL